MIYAWNFREVVQLGVIGPTGRMQYLASMGYPWAEKIFKKELIDTIRKSSPQKPVQITFEKLSVKVVELDDIERKPEV